MMNFSFRLLVLGCALACLAGAEEPRADVVTLTSGAERLTGNLRSIDDGVMELQSELSRELLRLRGAMVEKVEFAVATEEPEMPQARIELVNGDMIPCTVLEMDQNLLVADSPVLGRLRVERRHLAAIQFGIHAPRVVYAGPRDAGEWAGNSEAGSAWNFVNRDLVAKGQAFSSREIGFPERFDMKFELEWERNKIPSLQVFFCDPLVALGERCDRYYLQFGSAGLELKRESAKDRRYTTIAFVNRMPGECQDRRLRVELQVDRRASSLRLIINGKFEGEFSDPVGSVPKGAGMALVSHASDGVVQSLRGLEVSESAAASQHHRDERRVAADRESVITRKGERWTGELIGMSATNGGPALRFKSDFGDKPLELPEVDVSAVFFPQRSKAGSSFEDVLYLLRYAGGGDLRIASCRFEVDAATVNHPLLGVLNLKRNRLRSIEKTILKDIKSIGE